MTVHKLVPLLALGLNLLLLGSALAADRRGSRNVVFAYLAACLALWNLGVFGLRWTPDAGTALLWQRILHVGVIPIPVLFYHYVLVFLELPRRRLHGGSNGDRRAGVDVVDSGQGIPAELLPHVFEPFYTTKPEGAGTGLGLPISRRIVEAHGGTLQAESIPGRGTRMMVRLPLT